MIAFLDGTLVSRGAEAVIAVGEGSVGLTVMLTDRTANQLPATGQRVRLWTHLAVRDDSWVLYGFLTQEERAMFRLLITVAGVGPKLALGILSAASAQQIAGYLQAGDEVALARLPGIGRKSAARLVVELGQRIPESLVVAVPVSVEDGASSARQDGLSEAVAILTAMGLSNGQAEQALLRVKVDQVVQTEDLESWIRAALRGL